MCYLTDEPISSWLDQFVIWNLKKIDEREKINMPKVLLGSVHVSQYPLQFQQIYYTSVNSWHSKITSEIARQLVGPAFIYLFSILVDKFNI